MDDFLEQVARRRRQGMYTFMFVLLWIVITIMSGVAFGKITRFLPAGWWGFFLRGIVTFVGTNLLYALLMCRTKFFRYFVGVMKAKMKR